MAFPQVVAVAAGSPAEQFGLLIGDEIRSMNGVVPRDVIEYRFLADEPVVDLELARGGMTFDITVEKSAGELLGVEVSSPVFDRIRTCDNHCEFCFIYQLPKGLRKSLYVKDDDYRLSFLYGNFTTLTRFTELDLTRVVEERLSPLNVSIHATDPETRARILKNRRGATSLRWLRLLLDHGIEVHGQIVCCPGVNDGAVLEDTLGGILDRFPELSSAAVVPLGVSQFSKEAAMRPHTVGEAEAVIDIVERWQGYFHRVLGRPLVFVADEYYLLADRPFPAPEAYGSFSQHENGIGMVRAFEQAFLAGKTTPATDHGGFFASIDGAPKVGYRAARTREESPGAGDGHTLSSSDVGDPITVLTSLYGAAVLRPLFRAIGRDDVEILAIRNDFFGGNIAVTGLLTGVDVNRALEARTGERRYLLPDICLSEGQFLDGLSINDTTVSLEVIETDGAALRQALEHKALTPTRKRLRVLATATS